jgi:ribose 5-phosphate isomerase A
MTENPQNTAKKIAGEKAAGWIADGMHVGLGTGSTAAYAITELGRRIRDEGLRITGVPTSFAAERLAREHGIPLASLDEVEYLDFALDGADEVDPAFNLIKGRGGAHTRERVVAALARRFVVMVDASKLVRTLGEKMPLPVEVLPMACAPVLRGLKELGAEPEVRTGSGKDGPTVTDQGFWIIDARFSGIADPRQLAATVRSLPGVLDHGLFVELATDVLIGAPDGTVRHLQRDQVLDLKNPPLREVAAGRRV